MDIPPSGTVTFLFSDIEGSTRLWETHGEEMESALRLHDSVMRSCVDAAGGYVFSTAGDAFAVAFDRAGQAIAAAVGAQRALAEVEWGPVEIRVRMGLHTGEADERDGDYFGPCLNRGARLMAAAHGGQVLASGVTARLVVDRLPADVTLLDLGEHRLKDLDVAEHLFQVVDAALDREFPPIRTLDHVPNNLPRQLTRFVGRRREIDSLASVVTGCRLVTLTGVGGVGKTRLGVQVAAAVLDRFPAGVWFVELAGTSDASQVPKQIAVAVGIQEQADRPMAQTLISGLERQEALVILDNCEHLIGGLADFVEELLATATAVSVLATSREPLGIQGETVWTVEPMPVPESGQEGMADNEAVALFVDRARLAKRDFRLTGQNETACADICRTLDGVPLAIELAAARVGVLSAQEIATRLGDSMTLLSKGARTAAARQHTMRAAIDWSYELLEPDEQALLRRLAVFRGGFTLIAVEAMWSPEESATGSTVDLLERLVEKSLVMVTPSEPRRRFRLLETVRAYAWECLEHADELDVVLKRHRRFFLEWAHRQSRLVTTPDQLGALAALEADHDNLMVVLKRSLAEGDFEDALRLGADLSYFWYVHSHFGESGTWYEKLLAERERVDPHSRIKLLLGAGEFYQNTGSNTHAVACFEEARHFAQLIASPRLEGFALMNLFNAAVFQMDFDKAHDCCRQALQQFTAADHQYGIGLMTFLEASLDLAEQFAGGSTQKPEAERLLAELETMVEVVRAVAERNVLGHALEAAGSASHMSGRPQEAARLMAEAVDAFDTLGNQSCLAHCLERVALLAAQTHLPEDATSLLAATETLRERIGIAAPPLYEDISSKARNSAFSKLPTQRFDSAWRAGHSMDRREAVELTHEITTALRT